MLEVAKQKAMAENVNLILQRVDMSDFSTSHQVDLVLNLHFQQIGRAHV